MAARSRLLFFFSLPCSFFTPCCCFFLPPSRESLAGDDDEEDVDYKQEDWAMTALAGSSLFEDSLLKNLLRSPCAVKT
uniref:Uncharacterized protein n=1 Tax=Aegilops tauschii TaxID=37682 RepID=M8BC85_AEGTA